MEENFIDSKTDCASGSVSLVLNLVIGNIVYVSMCLCVCAYVCMCVCVAVLVCVRVSLCVS